MTNRQIVDQIYHAGYNLLHCRRASALLFASVMSKIPETIRVKETRIYCDGSGDVPAALGHPKVYLEIDEKGYVECGYCDRRFILIGGPADKK